LNKSEIFVQVLTIVLAAVARELEAWKKIHQVDGCLDGHWLGIYVDLHSAARDELERQEQFPGLDTSTLLSVALEAGSRIEELFRNFQMENREQTRIQYEHKN
jgi:hypothetical protein